MYSNSQKIKKINTDAKSMLKGLGLQEARVIWRLLRATLDDKKCVFFTMEHIDDVLEVGIGKEKVNYVTEQDKEYAVGFSVNNEQIKNTLRIFFDNWRGICESSENIQFVFYTNAPIVKEKQAGAFKGNDTKLPKKPLLQLLIDKDYDSALPFVLPVLKEYYIKQYEKHVKDISAYEEIWDAVTYEEWKAFFDLIEWNFGEKTGEEIWKENEKLARQLCEENDLKYSEVIMERIIGKFIMRMKEEDFLNRIVHVSEIENMFIKLYLESVGKDMKKVERRIYQPIVISENDLGRRFMYDANLISLQGREKEMKYLHDFCIAPGYLKWTAICGKGGCGKTRLAYEFCREMEELGWFTQLPCHANSWLKYPNLDVTNLPYNVLICLDYVKYAIEDIEEFMRLIQESGQFSQYKIRIILIERNAEDLEDLVQDESAVKGYLYSLQDANENGRDDGMIEIASLDNEALRLIIRDYISVYQKQLALNKTLSVDDENRILETLLNIDPDGKRPLYVLIIADAWCAGESLDKWDKLTALGYIIGKEMRRIDSAVRQIGFPCQDKSVYGDALLYAVTLATYVESIAIDDVYDFVGETFDVNREGLEWLLKETDYLHNDGQNITAVEPDLVGEYWCLQILTQFQEEIVKSFFESIYRKYFFEAIEFTNKLYNDHQDIIENASWISHIESITYPVGLTYVKKNTFRNCRFLKNVSLHNHISRIEAGAFRDCKRLETIVFPASLETIGLSAFAGCSRLTSALPSDKRGNEPSILTIQDNAFKGCISLVEVIIPESVDSIGRCVFEGCKQLKEIVIPRKINTIEMGTFANCSELARVVFSYRTQDNRIVLHSKAFWRCAKLCELKDYGRISYIGEKAFGNCESLSNLSFSSQLKRIGKGAFSDCIRLTEADFSACEIDRFSDQMFYNCVQLACVHLPESLREIGAEAFYNCRQLLHTKLPDGVKKIGSYAFGNCISLKRLELPCADVKVKDHAISGCQNITFETIQNIPDGRKEFCGFVFSAITEKEIAFLTTYATQSYVRVPDSVMQIGKKAFYMQRCLTQIQIPSSVKVIGNEAFKACNSLTAVDMNLNVISVIGKSAFEGCVSLERFKGQLRLKQIEDRAFKGCIALKKLIIAAPLDKIGEMAFTNCLNLRIYMTGRGLLSDTIGINAFLNCERMAFPINLNYLYQRKIPSNQLKLYGFVFRRVGKRELDFLSKYWNQENVVIPPTCIKFAGDSFRGNKTIKTIHVPYSISKLPCEAFADCPKLEIIRLPKGIKELPQKVFFNCGSLEQIVFEGFRINVIPDGVTIGMGAFSGCASLETLKLPHNLQVINAYTFCGCLSLREIDLPKGITHIRKSAFHSCAGLKTISIPNSLVDIDYCAFMGCSSLYRVNGLEKTQVSDLKNDAFKECASLETICLPKALQRIGAGAFYSCHSLKNIELPMTLDEIGMSAFEECYKLRYIRIPPGVTRIEKFTFKYCSSLQQIDHFHRIEHIGTSAFYHCSSLRLFRMPKRVVDIGISAFAFCNSLEEIEIPGTVQELCNGLFEACTLLRKVRLPDHIKSIPPNCFKECQNLVDINLPVGLEKIGAGAFRNCYSYDTSTLPDSLVEIQASAFRLCDSLSEITLPKSINSIAVSAFGYCSNLQKIDFTVVKQVDNYAFISCTKLNEIPIQNIEKRIGIAAFQNCLALSNVLFSQSITNIESAAFKGCSGIKRLRIPDSVKKIFGAVFRDNISLVEAELPESIGVIKKSAFRDCTALESVTMKSERIVIEKNVFRGCGRLLDLEIPAGSFVRSSAFLDCPIKEYMLSRKDITIIMDENMQQTEENEPVIEHA